MSAPNIWIDIEEVEGVGKVTARELKSHGICYLPQLLAAPSKMLREILGEDKAEHILKAAYKLWLQVTGAKSLFKTGLEVYEERQRVDRISTGVRALDKLLGGGIECRAVTELCGEFGAGKTQICYQLSVMAQLPREKGGLGCKVYYIDTEGTFRPERILEIAKKKLGLDDAKAREILRNIYYARAYTTDHLEQLVWEAWELIRKDNVRLVIIDSVIALYRAEYPGLENLAARQQRLCELLSLLVRMADICNVAVVITNHVQAAPDAYQRGGSTLGGVLRPTGGNVLAHAVTYRIWIRKSRGNIRIAKIFDSPCHGEAEAEFQITEKGVEDVGK